MDEKDLESFRSSLDANYEWPSLYPFKFIVPADQAESVLNLFADNPAQARESKKWAIHCLYHGDPRTLV